MFTFLLILAFVITFVLVLRLFNENAREGGGVRWVRWVRWVRRISLV